MDWKTRYIPELIVLPLVPLGFLYHIFFTNNWLSSLLAFGFAFGISFILFALGGIGGGDVKLMAAMGAWLGLQNIFGVLFIASVLGVIYGCYKLFKAGELKTRMAVFFNGFALSLASVRGAWLLPKLPKNPDETITASGVVPYGTFLAASTILWEAFVYV